MRATNSFSLTDSGNAELIAAKFAKHLRFDHRRGKWLVWTRMHWEDDCDGMVYRMAKEAARERLRAAASCENKVDRDARAGWALQSESAHRLDAALKPPNLPSQSRTRVMDGTLIRLF